MPCGMWADKAVTEAARQMRGVGSDHAVDSHRHHPCWTVFRVGLELFRLTDPKAGSQERRESGKENQRTRVLEAAGSRAAEGTEPAEVVA